MRYVLDTSALLAHYRQELGWEEAQALFETGDAELSIASVSLTEFGRRLRELGANEAEVETTLANYQLLFAEVISVDSTVAKAAFVIGQQGSDIDILVIGGTCRLIRVSDFACSCACARCWRRSRCKPSRALSGSG